MREIQSKDLEIEKQGGRSLASLIIAAELLINYGCCAEELEDLMNEFVELIDYLVERLDHADSERFK